MTFLSSRAGDIGDLYQRRADGTGRDALVLALKAGIQEALWSHDRGWIVMRTGITNGTRDLLALRVGRDTVPRPLLTGPWDEEAPALSPDGRWLAYVSTETGTREVFVRPFPDVDAGKWQVSAAGDTNPVWAHSGRELFFVDGREELVSQAVATGAAFRLGEQRVLFRLGGSYDLGSDAVNYVGFDVSPDDRRFLMMRRRAREDVAPTTTAVLVEHWLTEPSLSGRPDQP